MSRRPEEKTSARDHAPELDAELGSVAVFFDHENIAHGIKRGQAKFDPGLIIKNLSERGDVVVRRAYADWTRFKTDVSPYLEEGVEHVYMPAYGVSDKNRTDTAICVDAMDILRLQTQVDTFCIVSGDSDFGVLARRLRSNGKRVMGVSLRGSASKILMSVCHEFMFYESLAGKKVSGCDLSEAEAAIRSILPRLVDEFGESFQPSVLKDRLRRKDPSFSERNYGFQSWTNLLEEFPNLLKVERQKGGYNQVTVLNGDSKPTSRRGRK
jgi:uncharacterized LabA/DUF88 family protein